MAKKKNNNPGQALSPTRYIKERGRTVPIYKCYMEEDALESGEANIMVIRKHKDGKYTIAVYLVDFFCCGVKDSFYRLWLDSSEFEEIQDRYIRGRNMMEIDYVEAHNRIFGAIAWAEDAGIEPDKSFFLTQYLLEEDDDRVPLIEYEYGKNGHHCLITLTRLEASKYMGALKKNLGTDFEVHIEEEDLDDLMGEEDNYDDFDNYDETITEMQYTYPGGEYPEEVTIENPVVEELMRKETGTFTEDDLQYLRSLPKDALCRDLKNLILRELSRQWGKYEEELEEDETCNPYIMRTALTVLSDISEAEDYASVLIETMRQDYSSYEYNFGIMGDYILNACIYQCAKANLQSIAAYLLEPGLANTFKTDVYATLGQLAIREPEYRQKVIDLFRMLYEKYAEDLPSRTICDGTCVGALTNACCALHARELLPYIEKAYATGCVEPLWCGTYADVVYDMAEKKNVLGEIVFDVLKRLNT